MHILFPPNLQERTVQRYNLKNAIIGARVVDREQSTPNTPLNGHSMASSCWQRLVIAILGPPEEDVEDTHSASMQLMAMPAELKGWIEKKGNPNYGMDTWQRRFATVDTFYFLMRFN